MMSCQSIRKGVFLLAKLRQPVLLAFSSPPFSLLPSRCPPLLLLPVRICRRRVRRHTDARQRPERAERPSASRVCTHAIRRPIRSQRSQRASAGDTANTQRETRGAQTGRTDDSFANRAACSYAPRLCVCSLPRRLCPFQLPASHPSQGFLRPDDHRDGVCVGRSGICTLRAEAEEDQRDAFGQTTGTKTIPPATRWTSHRKVRQHTSTYETNGELAFCPCRSLVSLACVVCCCVCVFFSRVFPSPLSPFLLLSSQIPCECRASGDGGCVGDGSTGEGAQRRTQAPLSDALSPSRAARPYAPLASACGGTTTRAASFSALHPPLLVRSPAYSLFEISLPPFGCVVALGPARCLWKRWPQHSK